MATFFPALTSSHQDFIEQQHCFFVATAGNDTTVNLSPKGLDSLRIVDEQTVHWLNLTGSGNETAAHIRENTRMTLMFCSFDKQPLILRIYGQARVVHVGDEEWASLFANFPALPGARQIYVLSIDRVQTSCGFAVPYYAYRGERPVLTNHWDKRSAAAMGEYWQNKNTHSIDGKPTGIMDDKPDEKKHGE